MMVTITRLALLSTMGSLHAEPLRYDLESLRSIILDIAPDLLCAEITKESWENGDLSAAALEVREVIAPVIAVTDTVLVPIAPSPQQFNDHQAPPGWRQGLAQTYDRLLRWGQRQANGPEAIHGVLFETYCHTLCDLTEMAWTAEDRATWEAQNQEIAENITSTVKRDPGRRVLVAVQCQRIHKLEPLLKRHKDLLELVDYREL